MEPVQKKCSLYQPRNVPFLNFYVMKEPLGMRCAINGLMNELNIEHVPFEWRILIDLSTSQPKNRLSS